MALSVRDILNCMNAPQDASVVRDLFGFFWVPKELSVRRQLELMQGKHYHVNLILVGNDNFETEDWQETQCALQIARDIFEQVDFGIGKVGWYGISSSDAGSHEVIDSGSEAEDLTDDWTVDNSSMDVFVVRTLNGADGWSEVGGSCNKDKGKEMTGAVVSLNGSQSNSGNTFAHEMGHYLGLSHISDTGNFIGGGGGSDSWTGIKTSQGNKIKKHCFVRSGC